MCLLKSGMKEAVEFGRIPASMHSSQPLSTRGCSFPPRSDFLAEMWVFTDHFSVTSTFLHVKKEKHYLDDAPEMKCSPGVVIVLLLLLGKGNAS